MRTQVASVLFAAGLAVGLASCGGSRETRLPPSASSLRETPTPSESAAPTRAPSSEHVAPAAGVEPTVTIEALPDGSTYLLQTFRFPLARARLSVVDLGMTQALDVPLRARGATLSINGGFFTPTTAPEGLVVSEGTELSMLVPELSGGVLTIGAGPGAVGRLFEAETFTPPHALDFAIQCRPRLVVDGAPNIRTDDGRRASRTALCLRDGGRTLDVVVARTDALTGLDSGPTLYELSRKLHDRGCRDALNLDGGPSTGVAWRDARTGEVRLLPARGPVRHAVLFQLH